MNTIIIDLILLCALKCQMTVMLMNADKNNWKCSRRSWDAVLDRLVKKAS